MRSLRALAYDVLRRTPDLRDAHLRLFEVEQMLGQPDVAIDHLRLALRSSRIITLPAKQQPAALTILAITRVAPWEANTPLELVIDDQHTTLHRYYIDDTDAKLVAPDDVPPYDILFNSIAESDKAQHALVLARAFAERAGRTPVNTPDVVAHLGRADVARMFAASKTIVAPSVERASRTVLAERAVTAPLIVRPVGSQAGVGLARVNDSAELGTYLGDRDETEFFVTPFVDYSNADGFFRKYRIMFVAGKPYACHLAISPRWMIHYYNAAMAENQRLRDEEARFIAGMDGIINKTLADALREIAAAIPLEYFGIDCAIAPDGRLLLFEADAAMLVHGTDPPELYPYKRAGFERIQAALTALLNRYRASSTPPT